MSVYEKRIRERFPALVADSIWVVIERLVAEDWRDSDEFWFDDVQRQCIDISKRLGLPFGPAKCARCERDWPEAGDVPDTEPCPVCVAEVAAREAERQARLDAMTPEEREESARTVLIFLDGLITRNVF